MPDRWRRPPAAGDRDRLHRAAWGPCPPPATSTRTVRRRPGRRPARRRRAASLGGDQSAGVAHDDDPAVDEERRREAGVDDRPTSRSSPDGAVLLDDEARLAVRRAAGRSATGPPGRRATGRRPGRGRSAAVDRPPGDGGRHVASEDRRRARRGPGRVPATSWTRTHPAAERDAEGGRGERGLAAARSISRSRTPPEEGLVGRREQQRVAEARPAAPEARSSVERLLGRLAEVEPGVEHDPLGRDAGRRGPVGPVGEERARRRRPRRRSTGRGRRPGARAGCGWPPRVAPAGRGDREVVGVGEPADVVAERPPRPRRPPWPPRPARCRPRSGRRSGRPGSRSTADHPVELLGLGHLGAGAGLHAADVEDVGALADELLGARAAARRARRWPLVEERVRGPVEDPHDEGPVRRRRRSGRPEPEHGTSEQPGRQRLAVLGGPRVLGSERLEEVDELLARLVVVPHPLEQRRRATRSRRRPRRPARSATGPRPRACATSAVSGIRASTCERLVGVARSTGPRPAPTTAPRVIGLELERLAQRRLVPVGHEQVGLGAGRASAGRRTRRPGPRGARRRSRRPPCRPRRAYTAGIDCTWKMAATWGFSSTLTLTSSTAPPVASTTRSRIGPSVLHGPHHGAHRSTTTGTVLGTVEDGLLEGGIGHVGHDQGPYPARPGRPGAGAASRVRDQGDERSVATMAPRGIDRAQRVRPGSTAHVPDVEPPLEFALIAGGRSNLTFQVTDAAGPGGRCDARPSATSCRRRTTCAREHRIITRARARRRPGAARRRAVHRRGGQRARPSTSWSSSTATSCGAPQQ